MATIKDDDDEGSPRWKKLKGYGKWATPNTSTIPNDPSNQINRAKGEPQKAAPGVTSNHNGTDTINDGSTDVVVDTLHKLSGPHLGELGEENQHYPPCINPTCKSFGKSHPNCLCYAGPGGSSLEAGYFAHGGRVCSGSHLSSCEYYADGGEVEENAQLLNNPEDALDHVAVDQGLLGLLTKVGNSKSENPGKVTEDYVKSARRGHKTLNGHISNLIGKEKLNINPDKQAREALKNHLNELQTNPSELIDVGGSLGRSMPMHAAQLGAKTATAVKYLNNLKPTQAQSSPLDMIQPIDKQAEAHYNRALDVAQNPHIVLQHVKDGTLQPTDLNTLNTLYPSLGQSMKNKAGEALINAKTEGKVIPYHQKQGLSTLLGQPLDSTLTPMVMQSIIKSNAPMGQPGPLNGKPKKASGTELKQINKVNDLYQTPIEQRQTDTKS